MGTTDVGTCGRDGASRTVCGGECESSEGTRSLWSPSDFLSLTPPVPSPGEYLGTESLWSPRGKSFLSLGMARVVGFTTDMRDRAPEDGWEMADGCKWFSGVGKDYGVTESQDGRTRLDVEDPRFRCRILRIGVVGVSDRPPRRTFPPEITIKGPWSRPRRLGFPTRTSME